MTGSGKRFRKSVADASFNTPEIERKNADEEPQQKGINK